MKRALPHPLALALAALALLPASATAKEVVKAQVCGAGGCVSVSHAVAIDLMDGGPPTNPPEEAAPFFTARLWIKTDDDHTERFDTVFVPRYELMRGSDGTWMDPPVQTVTAFKRGASGLEASPASDLGPLPAPTTEPIPAPAQDPAPVDDRSSAWLIGALGLGGVLATWALVAHVRRRRAAAGTPPAAPTPPAG